ncbi:putative methionine transporter, NhaC family [Hathewaya proteolytica DSM 3090]|uniref:Putative methionine transporter, NhaC family n=1 Tax=Hathewaya proteolytica DSM 3090 TaxID=1121331 RepID=A0A1M6K601_9CLOT|nr:Na+/H+ antiporter NhaC family protein [Hathewaya proteolytica]SHJ54392.1 putative methionine transporter, NhaC family [Hathewaya proteolytica DSM 3090]
MVNESLNNKGHAKALIPFLTFILIYLGAGLIMQYQGAEMAFYQFPSVVAIFIATLVAFIINKGTINEKFTIFAKGAGSEDIMTMLMIYLLAGAFSTVSKAMGGVDATVNMGLSLIPAQYITVGIFIMSAFLSLATGTSMGTISAIVPIALGVIDKAGLSLPLVMGACVSGAMFGDNLSMISDTTISATRTQGCQLKDKFRLNFLIALPAAIITIVLLFIFGKPETAVAIQNLDFNFIKVLPYMLVLVLALAGINVFLVLIMGILSSGIIGICYGDLSFLTFAQQIWTGFGSMIEVFLLSLFCGGIAQLTQHYGGITWLLNKLRKLMKGKSSAQLGIAALVSLADMAVANNTVAIIISGPIAKDMSKQYKIDPRKTASLLDIFSCVFQGLIPYGAQFLVIGSLTKGAINPLKLISSMWYIHLLAIFAIIAIFVPYSEKACQKDPWNWEYDCAESEVQAKIASQNKPVDQV